MSDKHDCPVCEQPVEMVMVPEKVLLELVHWARRYVDGRMTFAPSTFNKLYAGLVLAYPEVMAKEQDDSHSVSSFPYAQDGNYNPADGSFDATEGLPEPPQKKQDNS